VTVKEDDSLKLTRSQDSVWMLKGMIRAEYNWEYLIEERICELAASFEFLHIDFFFSLFSFIWDFLV
jgi:hypothetical protein